MELFPHFFDFNKDLNKVSANPVQKKFLNILQKNSFVFINSIPKL